MRQTLRIAIAAVLAAALSSGAFADIVNIPAMTVPSAQITFENLPLGETTVAAINASAGANLTDINYVAPLAAVGNYSVGFELNRALALDPAGTGKLWIVDPGGDFGGGNGYSFDLGMMSSQIGLSIADYVGNKNVEFYDGSTLIGTSTVSGAAPVTVQFYESKDLGTGKPIPFDRVDITGTPNYVVPEMWVQIPEPATLTLLGVGLLALLRRR